MIFNLILKIVTLYLYILIGYGFRYFFSTSQKFFSKILFFVLIPAMVFKATLLSKAGTFLFLVGLSFFTTYNFYLLVQRDLLENHRQDSSDIRVDLGRSLVHEIHIGRYRFGNFHSLRK